MDINMLDHDEVSGRSKPAAAAGPGLYKGRMRSSLATRMKPDDCSCFRFI